MAYRKIEYGYYKKEITALLRKRLSYKERMRYHKNKAEEYSDKIEKIEKQVEDLEQLS